MEAADCAQKTFLIPMIRIVIVAVGWEPTV
jgi:hypothetical protein